MEVYEKWKRKIIKRGNNVQRVNVKKEKEEQRSVKMRLNKERK